MLFAFDYQLEINAQICSADFIDESMLTVLFILRGVRNHAMRPKARGLAQHGGPTGWLEESDPAGVILYVMDGPYRLLFRTLPVALTGAGKLRADGIFSCCYIVNVHNHQY